MGVGRVHTSELDQFVLDVEERGGIAAPETIAWLEDFELVFDTPVDTELDGFGETYFEQQIALYRELSGRDLDQEVNERSEFDIDETVDHVNPYATIDTQRVAHHARTILTTILVTDIPAGARVLDMGCGWGMSTEMFAFTGCDVTAVDINADFLEVVDRRASPRGYPVSTVRSAFDDFSSDETFDLVFFFECLHHAVDPAALLQRLAGNVAPGGKIAFAGEPVQATWWPSWGLRLDPISVYSIRKFGWFESGWSEDHLRRCFEQIGYELTMMTGIGLRHSPIGVAVPVGSPEPTPHWAVPRDPDAPPPEPVVEPERSFAERAARAVARRIFRH
ncbi:MAG: class I SAM-dependent methyltransferase [Actinomycetota bacterium]